MSRKTEQNFLNRFLRTFRSSSAEEFCKLKFTLLSKPQQIPNIIICNLKLLQITKIYIQPAVFLKIWEPSKLWPDSFLRLTYKCFQKLWPVFQLSHVTIAMQTLFCYCDHLFLKLSWRLWFYFENKVSNLVICSTTKNWFTR